MIRMRSRPWSRRSTLRDALEADRIASATIRTITEKMDEDPAFYRQFSWLLDETIRGYREKRISERDYLNNIVDLASRMARKDHGRRVPERIKGDEDAQAIFGVVEPVLQVAAKGSARDNAAEIAADGRRHCQEAPYRWCLVE